MLNRARGEVGTPDTGPLRLTLDGLARLESHYQVSGFEALGKRLASGPLGPGDLKLLIALGLMGAGRGNEDEAVEALHRKLGLMGLSRLASDLVLNAFGLEGGKDGDVA